MGWPYETRAEAAHAWGAIAAVLFVDGAIVAALVALNASDQDFRWWWPTNWMIVGVVIVVIGLALLIVPVRRSPHKKPLPPDGPVEPVFKGSSKEAKQADELTAEAVRKHIAEGNPPG